MIVDDVKMTRMGMSFLLQQNPDFEVIGEADNGRFFVNMLNNHAPDLVFMDVNMPMMNGIDATTEAMKLRPNLKVIALTNDDGEASIEEMTKAGAKGFLMKTVEFDELQKAIMIIMNGGSYIAPQLIAYYNRTSILNNRNDYIQLSPIENNILNLLCQSKSLADIARLLSVDVTVIEYHCENLSKKTNTRNAVGLVLYAIKNKLVKL